MDVRCEKCGTEYEFDEGKLKPGGVTVKCAECAHMFRVRKRTPTGVGVAPAARVSQPPPVPMDAGVPASIPPTPSPPAGGLSPVTGASGRVWLIRDEDGKVQTCRELAILQQWVVAGRVTRECEISRTGKSWKRLGTIAELGSFFRIAEEARRAATGGLPAQLPPRGNGEAAAPAAAVPETTAPLPAAVKPPAPAKRESGPPPSTRPRTSRPIPSAAGTPSPDDGSGPSGPMAVEAGGRTTGGWAAAPSLRLDSESDGAKGPTGGLAKGVPTTEAAFAAGAKTLKAPTADDIMPAQFEAIDAFDDDDITDFGSPRGGAGKWIVLFSLLLIGGAAGAVYFFVFKGGDKVDQQGALAAGAADAGVKTPTPTPTPTPPEKVNPEEVLTASYGDLAADTALAVGAAGKRLEKLGSDEPAMAARIAAARARVLTAKAQHALDAGGEGAASEAKKIAGAAAQLCADALAKQSDSADAKVAMADALRLKGSRTADVERHLKQVLQGDPRHREALYVRAMLRARDGKHKDARALLTQLSKDGTDVRPIHQLARMDFADKKYEIAEARVDRVLGMQSTHAGARSLKEAIAEATAVVRTDPMPPEVNKGGSKGGGSKGGGRRGGGSYDGLLSRADKLAESGKCSRAMDTYRRALDANPGGVGALVGMGYCHIDAKQFASAHAKFRAALGISSRHHGALIGIAEAYRYQGLKKQAIEAYQRYLEIHPSGRRAPMARKQLERLGGSTTPKQPDPDPDPDPAPEKKPDVPAGDPFENKPAAPAKKDTEDLGARENPGGSE